MVLPGSLSPKSTLKQDWSEILQSPGSESKEALEHVIMPRVVIASVEADDARMIVITSIWANRMGVRPLLPFERYRHDVR